MKIIITGATGSLGAALTRYFSIAGHEVIACGRDAEPPPNLLRYAKYFRADITKPFQFPEADVCVHTAALSDDKAAVHELYEPNVTGTKNVVQASAHCRSFIHISSSSVYLPFHRPITEDMAGKQDNRLLSPYGKSKLQAEEMLLQTTKHPACFILRPRAFYGAGDRVILPRILKLVKNDTFNRPGKMEVAVSLTHYHNIARAVELCMLSDLQGTKIYNVADDREYVLVDSVRRITREIYGRAIPEKEISIPLLRLLAFFRIGGLTPLLVRSFTNDMVLDLSKIRKELGYKAVMDLETQLPEMGDWIRRIGGLEVIRRGDKKLAWE